MNSCLATYPSANEFVKGDGYLLTLEILAEHVSIKILQSGKVLLEQTLEKNQLNTESCLR